MTLTKKVNDTARVAPLVVIPRHKLDEVVVERNAGLSIEDGGVGVTIQIGGDDVVFRVGEDA